MRVMSVVGSGAFGRVYRVLLLREDCEDDDDDDEVQDTKVIKTQKPACPWELYITNELHRRLAGIRGIPDVVRVAELFPL